MADMKTQGKMERIQGRVRSLWGDLTDDEGGPIRGIHSTIRTTM